MEGTLKLFVVNDLDNIKDIHSRMVSCMKNIKFIISDIDNLQDGVSDDVRQLFLRSLKGSCGTDDFNVHKGISLIDNWFGEHIE